MRHDGKRQLILYVPLATLDTIRSVAKSRRTTMSEFVTRAVEEKMAREATEPLQLSAPTRAGTRR